MRSGNHPLNPFLLNLVDLHADAKRGCVSSALQIATHHESGDLPGGHSLSDAKNWLAYAAGLGSVAAALRLARITFWQRRRNSTPEALGWLRHSIENAVSIGEGLGDEDMSAALAAARLLLESSDKDEDKRLTRDLLWAGRVEGHPDIEQIMNILRKNNPGNHHLRVTRGGIPEDSDFKPGIYQRLEQPLPLVTCKIPLDALRDRLDQEFPWFAEATHEVCRQLDARQQGALPVFMLRPLLLAGLPGIGKTSWFNRLAELCGIPSRVVMAAGSSDAAYLRGVARGWTSARPGAVLQLMACEQVANPLLLVDELDKASAESRNGRIWDALLQLLEPASSRNFLDECLQVPCDLSWVSWMATANELGRIPSPLLERFTIIHVRPPSHEHFETIVRGVVLQFARELAVDPRMLPSFDGPELAVLRKCNNPREIARTAKRILEESMTDARRRQRLN